MKDMIGLFSFAFWHVTNIHGAMAQEPLCSQDSYLLLQEGNYLALQTLLCLYMYIHISVFVTGSTHYVKNPRKLYISTISVKGSAQTVWQCIKR